MKKFNAVTFTLLFLSAAAMLLDWFTPAMGDDLSFWTDLGLEDYTSPDRSTLSYIVGHLTGCNARIFDTFGPVVINLLPRALAAAVMGLMAGFYFMTLLNTAELPSRRHTTISLAVLAFTVAVLPWWDSMWMRVCHFNYLWSAAFTLLFISEFIKPQSNLRESRMRIAMMFLLGVAAAGSHEVAALSIWGAGLLWWIPNRRDYPLFGRRKALLAGAAAATVIHFAMPALWLRMNQGEYRFPIGETILLSVPVMAALTVIVLVMMLFSRRRRTLRELWKGKWGFLVATGLIGSAVVIASGSAGRTGFPAESCAIAALAIMLLRSGLRIRRAPAVIASAACITFICAHYVTAIAWQKKLGNEFREFTEAFRNSPDGIVYGDYHHRTDVPAIVLDRVKGVPDADDWYMEVITRAYRTDSAPPVVLPPAFKGRLETFTGALTDGTVTICDSSAYIHLQLGDNVTCTTTASGRGITIVRPGFRDPGDPPLNYEPVR